jgi:DMSO/TMAO reductase YedYZ molybdopterin-dependent catalytic subunit
LLSPSEVRQVHVELEGHDAVKEHAATTGDGTGRGYGSSVPLGRVLASADELWVDAAAERKRERSQRGQGQGQHSSGATGKQPLGADLEAAQAACSGGAAGVLLAWAMNGEPLTADHGAPLRAIVPGASQHHQAVGCQELLLRALVDNVCSSREVLGSSACAVHALVRSTPLCAHTPRAPWLPPVVTRPLPSGVIGARSVKWLKTITLLQGRESDSFVQERDYNLLPPSVTWANVTDAAWAAVAPLQEMNVQAVTCRVVPCPAPGATIAGAQGGASHRPLPPRSLVGWYAVSGFALSGGGRLITRVDVSGDGGATWTAAVIDRTGSRHTTKAYPQDKLTLGPVTQGHGYGWVLWRAMVPVTASHEKGREGRSGGKVRGGGEVVVRAWDASGSTMAESPDTMWSLRGVLMNAWHRTPVLPPPRL